MCDLLSFCWLVCFGATGLKLLVAGLFSDFLAEMVKKAGKAFPDGFRARQKVLLEQNCIYRAGAYETKRRANFEIVFVAGAGIHIREVLDGFAKCMSSYFAIALEGVTTKIFMNQDCLNSHVVKNADESLDGLSLLFREQISRTGFVECSTGHF
jgi:hypothetical protein